MRAIAIAVFDYLIGFAALDLWLMAGGLAAFAEQWWWLKLYQQFGEASLFVAMLCVGAATTAFTPSGFIAKPGPAAAMRRASWVLLAAVGCAMWVAVWFRGDVKFAAVLPVVALSWLNRLLRHRLPA